jgi:dTDP-4-dehydrorhamnose 3,5-epimerase
MEWTVRRAHSRGEDLLVIFTETPLAGAFIIEIERIEDARGYFARTCCEHEFANHKLNPRIVQCSTSFNKRKGTLRGVHYQIAPYAETKLVRCTAGAIFDVIIDLRRESPTFKQSFQVILTAENHKALYIPEGLAHGFLTLEDNAEVFYQMSEIYSSEHARGVRWNDPILDIRWPFEPLIMSERDSSYPDFTVSGPAPHCSKVDTPGPYDQHRS